MWRPSTQQWWKHCKRSSWRMVLRISTGRWIHLLAKSYVKVHDPDAHRKNFSGPCYLRKSGRRTTGEGRFDGGEGDSGGDSGD
jgi:hypothetical protein